MKYGYCMLKPPVPVPNPGYLPFTKLSPPAVLNIRPVVEEFDFCKYISRKAGKTIDMCENCYYFRRLPSPEEMEEPIAGVS